MEPDLSEVLDVEFGGHFDPATVDPDARFVFDHPCLVASEALAQATRKDSDAGQSHRLRVGYFSSRRLNAGTLDTGAGESLIAISDSLPIELLRAFRRLSAAIDFTTMLPVRDSLGRVVVLERPVELASKPTSPREGRLHTKDAINGIERLGDAGPSGARTAVVRPRHKVRGDA